MPDRHHRDDPTAIILRLLKRQMMALAVAGHIVMSLTPGTLWTSTAARLAATGKRAPTHRGLFFVTTSLITARDGPSRTTLSSGHRGTSGSNRAIRRAIQSWANRMSCTPGCSIWGRRRADPRASISIGLTHQRGWDRAR